MSDYKEHKSKTKKQETKASGIKNVSDRRHKVYESIISPGETYTLTDADKDDERSGQRIKNAIESGKLERV